MWLLTVASLIWAVGAMFALLRPRACRNGFAVMSAGRATERFTADLKRMPRAVSVLALVRG